MTRGLWTIAACGVLWVWAPTARPAHLDAPLEPRLGAVADGAADLTPPPGSPVRRAVLDALRAELRDHLGLELQFVVKDLKVKDGWAWVHTRPQSPDGQSRFEDVLALLKLEDDVWKVVELPCTEPENPECVDGDGYFGRLLERFPDIPTEILPEGAVPASRLSAGASRCPS